MDGRADLFRQDAISSSYDRMGSPVNNYGVAMWLLVLFMFAVFGTALTFISVAKYTKKETVVGEVVTAEGVARITPLKPGIVTHVWVTSNQQVTAGMPLFSISYDPVLEGGARLSESVNKATRDQLISSQMEGEARREQAVQNKLESQWRLKAAESQISQLAQQRTLQVDRIVLLEQSLAAAQELKKDEFISDVQLRTRQEAVLKAKVELLQMDQAARQDQYDAEQLKVHLVAADQAILMAKAALDIDKASIEERNSNNISAQQTVIVAPKDGRVTSIEVRDGDVIASDRSLALVVPQGEGGKQYVNLWVPSRAVGLVERGDKVRLMFDAFPYQTFGVGRGTVSEISHASVLPHDISMPIDSNERIFKIVVALDSDRLTAYGKDWSLMPGMRLTADLIVDQKSLLGWLLDPLTAVRKRYQS